MASRPLAEPILERHGSAQFFVLSGPCWKRALDIYEAGLEAPRDFLHSTMGQAIT